jgi:DNA-binding response OmpR family regulator
MASILIWGDEHDSCLLARRVLEKLGHEVTLFTDPEDALLWSVRQHPELVVLDSKEGTECLHLFRKLHRSLPASKVMIMTSVALSPADMTDAHRLGAEVCLNRPMEIGEFEKRVTQLLTL